MWEKNVTNPERVLENAKSKPLGSLVEFVQTISMLGCILTTLESHKSQ